VSGALVEIAEAGAPEALHDRLGDLLDAGARASGRGFDRERLALEARVGGAPAGGLAGHLMMGVLYVERLALEPGARGGGLGRALLERAEDWARERGARAVFLDTFAFQAPGFYARLGYAEAFRLPGRVPGEARHFFVKHLDGTEP
jgi:GNAT superfamily N-acetyltransferase